MSTENLIKLRKKAEEVVRDMPDGKLKIKAFEVTLASLLAEPNYAKPNGKEYHIKSKSKDSLSKIRTSRKRGGPMERVYQLIDEGFFDKPKSGIDIIAHLKVMGYHYPITQISPLLLRLVQKRVLRRTKEKGDDSKIKFRYSTW